MILNETISKKQLREFGILIGFGFPIVIGWLLPEITGHSFKVWTLWVGVPGLILGIIMPHLLIYPYKGWMILGNVLGKINSKIILGLVFLLVLLPIAIIMRISRYDPLRKRRKMKKTYRENRQDYQIDLTRIF